MFEAIALALLLAIWCLLGAIPWLLLSFRRRGEAGFPRLALACALGIAGGVLVPLSGLRDWEGLLASLGGAVALPAIALLVLEAFAPTRRNRAEL